MLRKPKRKPATRADRWPPSKRRLEELVEEALVDAYGEAELRTAFFTMIEDQLAVPFETEVLGVTVTVERIDLTDSDEVVAICRRGKQRQPIAILDLPLPSPPPAGAEWIAAYRYWARRM
jgi:hypothetical protein